MISYFKVLTFSTCSSVNTSLKSASLWHWKLAQAGFSSSLAISMVLHRSGWRAIPKKKQTQLFKLSVSEFNNSMLWDNVEGNAGGTWDPIAAVGLSALQKAHSWTSAVPVLSRTTAGSSAWRLVQQLGVEAFLCMPTGAVGWLTKPIPNEDPARSACSVSHGGRWFGRSEQP